MGQRNDPPPARLGLHLPVWGVVVLLVCGLAGSFWAGWRAGLLEGESLTIVYAVVLGGFFNVTLLALFFWAWGAATARRNRIVRLNEELRYLLSWSGEESRRRKAGLIRELNALGIVPADLENAVLARADLKGANLRGCNLKGADLRRADLQGAQLDGADLWGADLKGANLSLAELRGANLRGCNLENAELVKVSFGEANLHRANLVNTNLYGTDLARVRLDRARFAAAGEGGLAGQMQQIHSSVEDWIRERLDEEGFYAGTGEEPEG